MTCQAYDERLGDYVDGALHADDARRVDAHLVTCARCRGIAADFAAIRSMARSLEPHAPPPRVWHAVSAATRAARPSPLRGWLLGWQPVAATAAVALIATALSWVGGQLSTFNTAAPATQAAATLDTGFIDEAHDAAEAHYVSAIAGLEALTSVERTALEPEMVDVLDSGMTVIDAAIDRSREALEREPESQLAQESLFQALRNKVALLQGTLTLADEMRRSDLDDAEPATPEMNR